ncbi:hypothetical protein TPY_3222 [Sulfobacillus acidophilus TPY]|nr:hypothetical protein TPY_3222 [Sulfobacillus acidophilus TPY]
MAKVGEHDTIDDISSRKDEPVVTHANQPTDEEWYALYRKAAEFYGLKPWQWLDDRHLFGVWDEETRTTGYCSVMGALGEVYALGVYLGSRGYWGLQNLRRTAHDWAAQNDAYSHQYALLASFEARTDLSGEEITLIHRLGLRFRGRHAWPSFRFHEPGYMPTPLTASQVRFLTRALRETISLAIAYRHQTAELMPQNGRLLVRKPGNDGREWETVWDVEPSPPAPLDDPIIVDEGLLHVAAKLPLIPAVWEADIFYLPMAIGVPPERLVVPRAFLLLDHESGMILEAVLDEEHFFERVWHTLIQTMRKIGGRPHSIWVRQNHVAHSLYGLTRPLGIELLQLSALPLMTEARRGLVESLRGPQSGG